MSNNEAENTKNFVGNLFSLRFWRVIGPYTEPPINFFWSFFRFVFAQLKGLLCKTKSKEKLGLKVWMADLYFYQSLLPSSE